MADTAGTADTTGPKILTAEWKAKLRAMTIPGDNRASLQRIHDEVARRPRLDPDVRARLEQMAVQHTEAPDEE
jgi:hypothetical protein